MCEGLQTLMNEDQAFLPLGMIGAGVMLQKYLILNDSGLHNVLTLIQWSAKECSDITIASSGVFWQTMS